MTLSPKERENIVEEETLRMETRRNLHGQGGRCRRWGWLWLAAFFLLGYVVRGCFDRRACAYEGGCRWESMMQGRCPYAQPQAGEQGAMQAPDQAPAAKGSPRP